MADFREYQGIDFRGDFIQHYGVGHLQGGHSGRFPWGSGENGGGATRSARDKYKTAKTNYRTAKSAFRKAKDRLDDINSDSLSTTYDKRAAQRDVTSRSKALDKAEVEFRKQKASYNEEKSVKRAENIDKLNAAKDKALAWISGKRTKIKGHKIDRKEDELDNISNKEISKLTDKELNDRINRLRQEDTYRQLLGQKTLGQLRRDKDKPKEIAKDAMENLVRAGLKDLVNKVIVPTATGHIIYTLAKVKNDEANALIREHNAEFPNDLKNLLPDIDYVSTVFKDAKRVNDGNGKGKKNKGNNQDQQSSDGNEKKNNTNQTGNDPNVKNEKAKPEKDKAEKAKNTQNKTKDEKEEYRSWDDVDKDREKEVAKDDRTVNSRNRKIATLFNLMVESKDIKGRTVNDVKYGAYSTDTDENRYGTKVEVSPDGYVNNEGSNYSSSRLRRKEIQKVKRDVTITVNSSDVKDMTLREYNEIYSIDDDDKKKK